jgi:predicted acyltransferase
LKRFGSVDALRGIAVAAMLLVNYPGDWAHVFPPLRHAEWHGFTPTDLIFPLFLFIVGVAIALAPAGDAGTDHATAARQVLGRAVRIVAVGLALNALAWWLLAQDSLRVPGVLQRIGLCYGIVALLALRLRTRWLVVVFAALLVGWWALLVAGGSLAPWVNVASRFDAAVFAAHAYRFDPATGLGHDPEGLASTPPAIATTLLGLFAGQWLRRGDLRSLLLAGAAALALGALWSHWLPWNKNLWTSSYVLWSGGWSLLLLAAAHVAVDRRGWPPLGRSFGRNAIVAYAGSSALYLLLFATGAWDAAWRLISAALAPAIGASAASAAFALAYVALWWAVMRLLQARGWRLSL